jgi:hypothetical protein
MRPDSTPDEATLFGPGAIAQLGERLDRTQEVAGSSPASSMTQNHCKLATSPFRRYLMKTPSFHRRATKAVFRRGVQRRACAGEAPPGRPRGLASRAPARSAGGSASGRRRLARRKDRAKHLSLARIVCLTVSDSSAHVAWRRLEANEASSKSRPSADRPTSHYPLPLTPASLRGGSAEPPWENAAANIIEVRATG